MNSLNGTATTIETEVTDTTAPKTKVKKVRLPELFIDGGSSHTKYYLDKISGSYQSVAREFPKGYDLPTGYLGVFAIGEKGYAVGDSALSLSGGKLHEGYADDNKIKLLPTWIIGALTTHPSFLFKWMKKVKTGTVEITIKLSLLSLSSHRKKEIEKAIKDITFTFDEREFKINISEYALYPEGYGAACAAKKVLKSNGCKDARFHILDLGGGTLTHTPYSNLNGVPRASNQNSVSGAGVMSITEFFAKESAKGDTGGNIYHFSRLKEALETSHIVDDQYSANIILGDTERDLGDRLQSGLESWAREIIGVRELLRDIKQLIRKGERVFLTGGGFKVEAVRHFVLSYLGNSELVTVLDNPQDVNITGIKS
ncbi:MAG: hypothetical protein HC874_23585 [Richelia sp. SL_2_1]|nr:hypothetical protein [Richelia sp. SL_2_1]